MFSHFGYEYVTRAIGRVKHLPKVAPDHPFEFFAATWLPGLVEGAPKASNESAQSSHASSLSELRFLILPSQTAMRLHQIVKPKPPAGKHDSPMTRGALEYSRSC
jgi:hypothetical protein